MSALQPTMTAVTQAPPSWLIYGGKSYTANIEWTNVTATNTEGTKIIYSGSVMVTKSGTSTFQRMADRSAASTISAQRTVLLLNDTTEDDGAGAIIYNGEFRLGILDTVNANLLAAAWTGYGTLTGISTLTDLTPTLANGFDKFGGSWTFPTA